MSVAPKDRESYGGLVKDQSARSLSKFKTHNLAERVEMVSRELMGARRQKPANHMGTLGQSQGVSHLASQSHIRQVVRGIAPQPSQVNHLKSVRSEEELSTRVSRLENELKRKIGENDLLADFLRTKNSSQVSHIDIYLEMRRLEELLLKKAQHIYFLEDRDKELEAAHQSIQHELDQQELQHLESLKLLERQVELKERSFVELKASLTLKHQRQIGDIQAKHDADKLLCEQLRRKNADLHRKNKQLEEDIEVERGSSSLTHLQRDQEKASLHQTIGTMKRQIEGSKQKIQELHRKLKEEELLHEQVMVRHRQESEGYEKRLTELEQYNQMEIARVQTEALHERSAYQKELSAALKQQQNSFNQSRQALSGQIQVLADKLLASQQTVQVLEKQKAKIVAEVSKADEKAMNLTGQVKVLKFQREETRAALEKLKGELAEKNEQLTALESRLSRTLTDLQMRERKLEDQKKTNESSESLLRLNSKMHGQNYKATGRILQLTSKLKCILPSESQTGRVQEELGQVLSVLAEQIDRLGSCYTRERKMGQDLRSAAKECAKVFETFRTILPVQHGNIYAKFIQMLQDCPQEVLQLSEVVHQITIHCANWLTTQEYPENNRTVPSSYRKEPRRDFGREDRLLQREDRPLQREQSKYSHLSRGLFEDDQESIKDKENMRDKENVRNRENMRDREMMRDRERMKGAQNSRDREESGTRKGKKESSKWRDKSEIQKKYFSK